MTMLIFDDMSLQSLAQTCQPSVHISTLVCPCTVPSRQLNVLTDPAQHRMIFTFTWQMRHHLMDLHTWMLCSISMLDWCIEILNSFRSWWVSTASMLAARLLRSCTLYGRRSANDCSHLNYYMSTVNKNACTQENGVMPKCLARIFSNSLARVLRFPLISRSCSIPLWLFNISSLSARRCCRSL